MTTSRTAEQASRLVRIAVASFVVTVLPAVAVAHQVVATLAPADDVTEVVRRCDPEACGREMSSEAAAQVAVLDRQGLKCAPTPTFTDVVVVEWLDRSATVVTFDEALAVAAGPDGWLRSYCVDPRAAR